MEPTTSTQDTHFDVAVFSHVNAVQRLQAFIGGLIVFAIPTFIVIARSTAPLWLTISVAIMVLAGIAAFYNVAKPRMFVRYGYKLVCEELSRSHHRLRIMSFEDNGRFVAIHRGLSVEKVHGVMTFVEMDGSGVYLKYRIDLLPE